MNHNLFLIINSWAGHIVWLDRIMIFLGNAQGYLMVGLLVILAIKDLKKYTDMFLVATGSAIIGNFVFATTIKYLYHSPRPYWVLNDIVVLFPKELENSFPSSHMAFFFALSIGVYKYNKKLGILFICQSLLMGFARIYTGVHWPLDILGGIILGSCCGWLGSKIYRRLTKEKILA